MRIYEARDSIATSHRCSQVQLSKVYTRTVVEEACLSVHKGVIKCQVDQRHSIAICVSRKVESFQLAMSQRGRELPTSHLKYRAHPSYILAKTSTAYSPLLTVHRLAVQHFSLTRLKIDVTCMKYFSAHPANPIFVNQSRQTRNIGSLSSINSAPAGNL